MKNAGRNEPQKLTADMNALLQEQSTAINEYYGQLAEPMIEKVTIYEDKFPVKFKSSLIVNVKE